MCDCALTRFDNAAMVSLMLAVANTSPNPNTVTVWPAKHCLQIGKATSESNPLYSRSLTSNRSASASVSTETSLWSPKCSSQNRRASACFSLFAVRVLNLCNCVACTKDSTCLRSSSSVSPSSFSAAFTSLPFDARVIHKHTLLLPSTPSAIASKRVRRRSSSATQLWMLPKITRVLLSSWFNPSTIPSI